MSETLKEVAVDLAKRLAAAEANSAYDGFDAWEHRGEYLHEYMARIESAEKERTCHAVEELEPDGVGAPPRHTIHCSRCGQLWDETGGVPRCPAYCPACGARVTEGETDE